VSRRTWVWLMLLPAVHARPVVAQRPDIQPPTPYDTVALSNALDAERSGAPGDALTGFERVLRGAPANIPALMGLDRVLSRLDRRPEMLPWIARALAVDSTTTGVLLEAVRSFAMLGHADSAARYALRWSSEMPGDESPYREWSMAALEVRDAAQAQAALEYGRAHLGPDALSLELAQLSQQRGEFAGATREWVTTLRHSPELLDGATGQLAQVPASQRSAVRDALVHDGRIEARQLLGLLDLTWGDIDDGIALVHGALPSASRDALSLLNAALGALHGRNDATALQARASTLELMADREPSAEAARTRLTAATAYARAGDQRDARRLLDLAGAAGDAPASLAAQESTTRLDVLLAEGNAAGAESLLARLAPSLGPDARDQVSRRLARAWVARGGLDHADSLVARDSSTGGLDLRGWLQLYRGHLAAATTLLKLAGPFDDDRRRAEERMSVLALLQLVGKDSLPALGAGFATLARGDTAGAVRAFDTVAAALDTAGSAELRLWAGRLALARGDTATATAMLHAADLAAAPATAPAAQLELARISAATGHRPEASAILERLIVDYPASAAVPAARRLYDVLRGAVPADTATGGGR
jgi:hypothetical protein